MTEDFTDDFLSPAGWELYERLLAHGSIPYEELACGDADAFTELEERKALRCTPSSHSRKALAIPVPPESLRETARWYFEQRVRQLRERNSHVADRLAGIRPDGQCAGGTPIDDPRVRLLLDADEITAASGELPMRAERDLGTFVTHHFRHAPPSGSRLDAPSRMADRGIRCRALYTSTVFDEIVGAERTVAEMTAAGWQARVVSDLPLKLIVVDDRVALLALDPTGLRGSLLVTAPAVVAALWELFEAYWMCGVAVRGDTGASDRAERLARHLALGRTDVAIAHHLEVSPRTARRWIACLMDDLGAKTRFQAGYYAARRGLI